MLSLMLKEENDYIKFDQKIILTFMIDIAEALKEMHDNCIAHRDIKPENILFKVNENK